MIRFVFSMIENLIILIFMRFGGVEICILPNLMKIGTMRFSIMLNTNLAEEEEEVSIEK